MAKFALRVVLAGAGAACAIFWTQKNELKAHTRTNSVKWDSNWDHRAENESHNVEKGDTQEANHEKRRASKHIFLIRHGHFETNSAGEKVLTIVGRWQAGLTGQRLRDLGHPYSVIHHSTMPRAVETAHVIYDTLADTPLVSCDLLREGAPAVPDPPVSHWTPTPHVSTTH